MTFQVKPLPCDPQRIKGMSERLIISHYENNYGGAVKRLNLIEEQLAELNYTTAPGFVINGLKREQLIAMNSMILHELFFAGLGDPGEPNPTLREALTRDFGSLPHAGRRHADSGARYVRAFLSYRFRRQGCDLRRYVHGRHRLEERRADVQFSQHEFGGGGVTRAISP